MWRFIEWLHGKPAPRTDGYLPGDLVEITLSPGCMFHDEYSGRSGVVTHGPDDDGGWIVSTALGGLRCVAEELTMITPREDR